MRRVEISKADDEYIAYCKGSSYESAVRQVVGHDYSKVFLAFAPDWGAYEPRIGVWWFLQDSW